MKDLILVFLFATGQVQFSTLGLETADVQSFEDKEENKAAFVKLLTEQSSRKNAKVCAVIPSYEYESILHKPLDDLLTEKGNDLPGIWEEQDGVKRIFSMKADAAVSIEDAVKFCKLAAPIAFRDPGKK